MKRIFLFLVTNLAVLALLSLAIFVVERVFGVHLTGGGLGGLLAFVAICGFGGALLSLALSKWTAKRMLIFDAAEMNAFATGARRNAALVAVSSGLLRGMSRAQIEAVLGHEMSHLANGDMVTLALLQGVLNTFVIFLARIIGSIVDKCKPSESTPAARAASCACS